MSRRPGAAPRVRVDGSSGRPVSARGNRTVEERRAEIVAANARLRSQLQREKGQSSRCVSVRPSADQDLRALETQRDTLRAQLLQLTGVLQNRREELAGLRRSCAGVGVGVGAGAPLPLGAEPRAAPQMPRAGHLRGVFGAFSGRRGWPRRRRGKVRGGAIIWRSSPTRG